MDEPTEGLAPVIVSQVEDMLVRLAEQAEMSVLVIEQNIGVATEIAENVAIMVNGRINRVIPSAQLAGDRELQQRLLGVGRHGHADIPLAPDTVTPAGDVAPGDRAAAHLSIEPVHSDALVAARGGRADRGAGAHLVERQSAAARKRPATL